MRPRTGRDYGCSIAEIRAQLEAWGGPWSIENVVGAPLRDPIMLCGSSFGLQVRRHRLFEASASLESRSCRHDLQPAPIDVTGTGSRRKGRRVDGRGGDSRKPRNIAEARTAMGISWMSRRELSQAIPPAYSEFIGRQIRNSLAL